jgi:hypothetical protein
MGPDGRSGDGGRACVEFTRGVIEFLHNAPFPSLFFGSTAGETFARAHKGGEKRRGSEWEGAIGGRCALQIRREEDGGVVHGGVKPRRGALCPRRRRTVHPLPAALAQDAQTRCGGGQCQVHVKQKRGEEMGKKEKFDLTM